MNLIETNIADTYSKVSTPPSIVGETIVLDHKDSSFTLSQPN